MVETSDQQLDEERRELLRQNALAEHAVAEAQEEIERLRERLLALETELARARQALARQAGELDGAEARLGRLEGDLEQAQRGIQEMQATRVWRFGTGYWRLRDRLFGDR